jgi:hypothetical protein
MRAQSSARAAVLLTSAIAAAGAGEHATAADVLERGMRLQRELSPPHDDAVQSLHSLARLWQEAGQTAYSDHATALAAELVDP